MNAPDPSNCPQTPMKPDALARLLVEQAKKCKTPSGAGLLLAIKGHIEGHQVYEGCDELWQAADAVAGMEHALARLEAWLAEDSQRECVVEYLEHDDEEPRLWHNTLWHQKRVADAEGSTFAATIEAALEKANKVGL